MGLFGLTSKKEKVNPAKKAFRVMPFLTFCCRSSWFKKSKIGMKQSTSLKKTFQRLKPTWNASCSRLACKIWLPTSRLRNIRNDSKPKNTQISKPFEQNLNRSKGIGQRSRWNDQATESATCWCYSRAWRAALFSRQEDGGCSRREGRSSQGTFNKRTLLNQSENKNNSG